MLESPAHQLQPQKFKGILDYVGHSNHSGYMMPLAGQAGVLLFYSFMFIPVCLNVYVYAPCVCSACRDEKMSLDTQGLALHTVVSCHVGAED